jgi:hypothetical protein
MNIALFEGKHELLVSENEVLSKIGLFVFKKNEEFEKFSILYNEELCDLNELPNILRIAKSRKFR